MKVLRYATVGGFAALVDFSIFAIFARWLDFNYFVVGAVGFIFATTVNYFLSIRFVFVSGARFKKPEEITLVFLVSLVGLAMNQMVLYTGIGLLNLEMLLVKIVATATVFLWNYHARNRYVFQPFNKSKRHSVSID